MEGRGGVGLVFVNDVGGSMFLHIARVVPVLACPLARARPALFTAPGAGRLRRAGRPPFLLSRRRPLPVLLSRPGTCRMDLQT